MPTLWVFLWLQANLFALGTSNGVQSRIRDVPQRDEVPWSVLAKATLGVDPVYSDLFGQFDPGMKDQIFEATRYYNGTKVLNDFIGKAVKDVRCQRITSSTAETITNFNSYLEHESESVSFSIGAGLSLEFANGLSIGASVGYAKRNSQENKKLLEFFQKTSGEIIQSSSRCQTHVVSLNTNVKAAFTQSFIASLRKLNTASKNPLSNSSIQVFREFVNDFGTYYQDETLFGAQVTYESRFSEKSTIQSEKTERQECVSSSFSTSLGVGVSMFHVNQNFKKASDNCASSASDRQTMKELGVSSVKISSVGMPPVLDSTIWTNSVSISPVPVKYRLQKISTLFLTDWFQSIFETGQPDQSSVDVINGTAMYEFFETLSGEYCEIMLGMPCEVISHGCGYNSSCLLGQKCIPDKDHQRFTCQSGCGVTDNCTARNMVCKDDSTELGYSCLKYCEIENMCPSNYKCYEEPNSAKGYMCVRTNFGKTLIAGGKLDADDKLSSKTESGMSTTTYNELYQGVYLNALAQSRGRLFMCGGGQKDRKGSMYHTMNCYRFSAYSPFSDRKRITSLPTTAYFISAASIGYSSVWFIVSNKLHKLDTYSEKFSTVNLPFNADGVHCTVANRSHAYIIGAGSGRNEIWVNKYENNEKIWKRVGLLSRAREWHACLWYGSNIMITGGYPIRSHVEMFNTETNIRWTGVSLPGGRHDHRMMMYYGKPTVVGGRGGRSWNFLSDLLSFDLSTQNWTTCSRHLTEGKEGFALLQY